MRLASEIQYNAEDNQARDCDDLDRTGTRFIDLNRSPRPNVTDA